MKKLMIAAAIVSAAALAQASTFSWSSGKTVYSIDAGEFTKGLVAGKTYDAATTGSANNMKSQAGADAQGIVWKMIMSITDANGTDVLDPYTITSYNTTSKPKSATDALSSDKVFKPASEEAPACVFDAIVKYEGTWVDGNGNTWTLTSNEIKDSFEIGSQDDLKLTTSAAPTKWTVTGGPTPGPVPEPTSGLLLLLGMAGLALRRRRA